MGSILARLQHDQVSTATASDEADKPCKGGTRFTDLPEACLALILSHVGNPRDVIRLALVSRSFRDASHSDTVWEGLLPRNYAQLVRDAEDGPPRYSLKKEVYDFLCKEVYLADANQAFWLDPPTGATCLMVSAKALHIVWGDDPRYWKWVTKPGSRFKEVAHLETVCWLEVRGHIACQLTPGRYTLAWRIQMSEFLPMPQRVNHPWRLTFPHAMVSTTHAWNHKPVRFSLSTGDGQQADSSRYLDGQSTTSERQLTLSNLATLVCGKGKWMEYVAGEFVVDSEGHVDLDFSMMEIEGGNWKEGLFLDGVAIRPSQQT